MISVLLPCGNVKDELWVSIRSVLGQTRTDIEILVLDHKLDRDVESWAIGLDRRIRVINCKHCSNLAAVLNRGLSEAKGRYIARMDADDYMMSRRLELQIRLLEECEDLIAVGSSYIEISERDSSVKKKLVMRYERPKMVLSHMWFGNPCSHPSLTFDRERSGQDLRYDEEYEVSQDYELITRLCKRGRIVNLPHPLMVQLKGLNSVTSKRNRLQKKMSARLQSRLEYEYKRQLPEGKELRKDKGTIVKRFHDRELGLEVSWQYILSSGRTREVGGLLRRIAQIVVLILVSVKSIGVALGCLARWNKEYRIAFEEIQRVVDEGR